MTLSPSPSNYHNHPIPLPLYSQQIPKRHPFTKRAVETSFPIFDNAILKSARGGKRNCKRQEEDDEEEEEIGGFPYGIISSISGGNSCGKTLIAMHTITSHLLANPESHVAWVDTDGNFSAQRLLEIVALRLSQQQQQQQQTKSEKPTSRQELLQQAGKVLDRVQITKAFDMDAVMQSLEEIKMNMEEWEKEKEKKDEEARKERLKVIRSSVDSEDEIVEDEQESKNAGGAKEGSEVGEVGGGDAVMDGRVGVLVIDTISTLSERVRLKKQIAADSILTTFSRTTALLAKNWSIAVLLLDTPPTSNTQQLPQQQQQHSYQPSKSTSDSIFAEIKQSPSLGPVLEFAVDFKVMLSHFDGLLEGGKEAQQGRRQQQQRRGRVEPIIFEVVSDRQGSRRGNWVVYAIKQNGYEIIEFPWPKKEQGPPAKMRSAFRGGLE